MSSFVAFANLHLLLVVVLNVCDAFIIVSFLCLFGVSCDVSLTVKNQFFYILIQVGHC